MGACIGIDFGERRIGVAASDSNGILAVPVTTIDTKNVENPFSEIKSIIEEYSAETVVIGYPLRTDGTMGDKAMAVDEFIRSFEAVCPGVNVVRQDERYSSCDAANLIKISGKKKKGKFVDKKLIDRMAAAIILQEYIDSVKKAPANISLLVLLFLFLSGCLEPTRYSSNREKPYPPVLTSLTPGTYEDSIPAIIVGFSYTDTVAATIRVDTAGSDSMFSLRVYGIPSFLNRYADIFWSATGAYSLKQKFYRLHAVTSKDSLSNPSNILPIYLLTSPPVIDSVYMQNGTPAVLYTVFAEQGVTRRVAITMNDSVLSEKTYSTTFRYSAQFTEVFATYTVDSLRSIALMKGRSGKPFGIRIIVELPAYGSMAYAIAAAPLHLP